MHVSYYAPMKTASWPRCNGLMLKTPISVPNPCIGGLILTHCDTCEPIFFCIPFPYTPNSFPLQLAPYPISHPHKAAMSTKMDNTPEKPTDNNPKEAWFTPNVQEIPSDARELLETYSKIPSDEVLPHVLEQASSSPPSKIKLNHTS